MRTFQDQLRDAAWIDPHRHVAPAFLFNPSGVYRQIVPVPRALREDPVSISKSHCDWHGDAVAVKRSTLYDGTSLQMRTIGRGRPLREAHRLRAYACCLPRRAEPERVPAETGSAWPLSESPAYFLPRIADSRTHASREMRRAFSTNREEKWRRRSARSRDAPRRGPRGRRENFRRCPQEALYQPDVSNTQGRQPDLES